MHKIVIYSVFVLLLCTNLYTQYSSMYLNEEQLIILIRDWDSASSYYPVLLLSPTGLPMQTEWYRVYDRIDISVEEKQELIDSLSSLGGTKYSLNRYTTKRNLFTLNILRGQYLDLFSIIPFEENSDRIFEIFRNVLDEERSDKAISVINKLYKINNGELEE